MSSSKRIGAEAAVKCDAITPDSSSFGDSAQCYLLAPSTDADEVSINFKTIQSDASISSNCHNENSSPMGAEAIMFDRKETAPLTKPSNGLDMGIINIEHDEIQDRDGDELCHQNQLPLEIPTKPSNILLTEKEHVPEEATDNTRQAAYTSTPSSNTFSHTGVEVKTHHTDQDDNEVESLLSAKEENTLPNCTVQPVETNDSTLCQQQNNSEANAELSISSTNHEDEAVSKRPKREKRKTTRKTRGSKQQAHQDLNDDNKTKKAKRNCDNTRESCYKKHNDSPKVSERKSVQESKDKNRKKTEEKRKLAEEKLKAKKEKLKAQEKKRKAKEKAFKIQEERRKAQEQKEAARRKRLEERKIEKQQREEERKRKKEEVERQKSEQRRQRDDEKRLKKEQQDLERKRKEEEKIALETKKKLPETKMRTVMQQFLVKKETPDKREGMVILDTSVRGFGAFVIQKGMTVAPLHPVPQESRPSMMNIDYQLEGPLSGDQALCEFPSDLREEHISRWRKNRLERKRNTQLPRVLHHITGKLERIKLLQFWEDVRPPLYGTWTKASSNVRPCQPFGQDSVTLDYDHDSEAEWEFEPEDAEECKSDDEEDQDEEGEEEVCIDGWIVPHGYLSEDEGAGFSEDDEEDEDDYVNGNLHMATTQGHGLSQSKFDEMEAERENRRLQKAVKQHFVPSEEKSLLDQKAFSCGVLWDDVAATHAFLSEYVAEPLVSLPINPHETLQPPVKAMAKRPGLEDELLPNLIKFVHGTTYTRKHIAEHFASLSDVQTKTGVLRQLKNSDFVVKEVRSPYLRRRWFINEDVLRKHDLEDLPLPEGPKSTSTTSSTFCETKHASVPASDKEKSFRPSPPLKDKAKKPKRRRIQPQLSEHNEGLDIRPSLDVSALPNIFSKLGGSNQELITE